MAEPPPSSSWRKATPIKAFLVALAAIVATCTVALGGPASADEVPVPETTETTPAPPAPTPTPTTATAVVIGDSISDINFWHSRHQTKPYLWWSKLGRATHTKVKSFSERGSGYTRPGRCRTTTIPQRVEAQQARIERARFVVIQGGVNDYRRCVRGADGRWHSQRNTPEDIRASVEATFTALDDMVVDNRKIIITMPYGDYPPLRAQREITHEILKTAALAHGFQYVDTAHGTLTKKNTFDRIHPNKAGMQRLYRTILTRSDLRTRTRL